MDFELVRGARLSEHGDEKRHQREYPSSGSMALLIRNQAAFVEQISRNDQERLALQRQSDEWQRRGDERFARMEEWQRKSDERVCPHRSPIS